MLDPEQLFLLEFLVDSVYIHRLCGKEISNRDWLLCGQTVVSFQFLNFQAQAISDHDFPKDCPGAGAQKFESGKSCLFSIPERELLRAPGEFIINIGVYKRQPAGILPECVQVGEAKIDLTNEFTAVVCDILRNPKETPASNAIKDTFVVHTPGSNEPVGMIRLFIRLSCFGKSIVTEFSLGNGESYLFKGNEDNLYRCQQIKQSLAGPPPCGIRTDVCPQGGGGGWPMFPGSANYLQSAVCSGMGPPSGAICPVQPASHFSRQPVCTSSQTMPPPVCQSRPAFSSQPPPCPMTYQDPPCPPPCQPEPTCTRGRPQAPGGRTDTSTSAASLTFALADKPKNPPTPDVNRPSTSFAKRPKSSIAPPRKSKSRQSKVPGSLSKGRKSKGRMSSLSQSKSRPSTAPGKQSTSTNSPGILTQSMSGGAGGGGGAGTQSRAGRGSDGRPLRFSLCKDDPPPPGRCYCAPSDSTYELLDALDSCCLADKPPSLKTMWNDVTNLKEPKERYKQPMTRPLSLDETAQIVRKAREGGGQEDPRSSKTAKGSKASVAYGDKKTDSGKKSTSRAQGPPLMKSVLFTPEGGRSVSVLLDPDLDPEQRARCERRQAAELNYDAMKRLADEWQCWPQPGVPWQRGAAYERLQKPSVRAWRQRIRGVLRHSCGEEDPNAPEQRRSSAAVLQPGASRGRISELSSLDCPTCIPEPSCSPRGSAQSPSVPPTPPTPPPTPYSTQRASELQRFIQIRPSALESKLNELTTIPDPEPYRYVPAYADLAAYMFPQYFWSLVDYFLKTQRWPRFEDLDPFFQSFCAQFHIDGDSVLDTPGFAPKWLKILRCKDEVAFRMIVGHFFHARKFPSWKCFPRCLVKAFEEAGVREFDYELPFDTCLLMTPRQTMPCGAARAKSLSRSR